MVRLNALQQGLETKEHSRSWSEMCRLFDSVGVELHENLLSSLNKTPDDSDFVVLDAGCGPYGSTLKDLIPKIKNYADGRVAVNGVGIDLCISDYEGQLPNADNKGTSEKLPSLKLSENFDPHVSANTLRSKSSCHLVSDSFSEVPKHGSIYLLNGSLTSLPFNDGVVDFGYSVATLQYTGDALKALYEGYRVLKEGGRMYWLLSSLNDVSYFPFFYRILDDTPGANRIFRWVHDPDEDFHSVLICEKDSNAGFNGFVYSHIFNLAELLRTSPADKYKKYGVYAVRNGIVEKLSNVIRGIFNR